MPCECACVGGGGDLQCRVCVCVGGSCSAVGDLPTKGARGDRSSADAGGSGGVGTLPQSRRVGVEGQRWKAGAHTLLPPRKNSIPIVAERPEAEGHPGYQGCCTTGECRAVAAA